MRKWLTLATVTTGTFMANLDTSIVNVALPVLGHRFHAGPQFFQWVTSAYLLSVTALLPMAGRLADRIGRKRVFQAGVLLFVLGSALCALSPSLGALIAFRAVQGAGASLFMATVLAIVLMAFPGEERGQAIGFIGSVVAAGSLAGPALGGFLIDLWGWRSIFLINLPIGIAGAWIGQRVLPASRPSGGEPVDWSAGMAFGAATGLLLTYLSQGPVLGFLSPTALLLLGGGVFASAVVWWRSVTVPHPLIPVDLFRLPTFALGNLAGGLSYVILFFSAVLLPYYLHRLRGLAPHTIGLLMTAQALTMVILSPLGGRWADRSGPLLPTTVGIALFGASQFGFASLDAHTPLGQIVLPLVLLGAGYGLFMSPNNASVMAGIPQNRTGTANGMVSTIRNLGMALGVAIGIGLFDSRLAWLRAQQVPYATAFLSGMGLVFHLGLALSLLTLLLTVLRPLWEERPVPDSGPT